MEQVDGEQTFEKDRIQRPNFPEVSLSPILFVIAPNYILRKEKVTKLQEKINYFICIIIFYTSLSIYLFYISSHEHWKKPLQEHIKY